MAGSPARAEQWVPLAQGGGATLLLDKDSVTTTDGQTHYVSRMLYSTPQQLTDTSDQAATYTELRNQVNMDCANKLQSPVAGRFYDASGKMVAEILTPDQMRPITAGSSADWEFKAVCTTATTDAQTSTPAPAGPLP